MTAGHDESIGARLRTERERRGWSRRQLAGRIRGHLPDHQVPELDTVADYVKRWEAGKVGISDRYRAAYAEAFGVDEGALFDVGAPAPSAVLAELLPPRDLPARITAVTGMSTVKAMSARVHALRLADDVLAGKDLLVPAFRELETAVRVQREGTHTEQAGRALLSMVGEFAQIAGWVASDAGLDDRAADAYRLGISAAREAGDVTLESNLMGSLAYQTSNVGDPAEAVALAAAAVEVAGPDAPPRARALAWDRLAWARARAQDAQAAMRALGEASEAMAGHDGEQDPPYLYWVSEGELQIMEARAYTELRRPLRAVPLLADVLSRYDATHARELALYLSWLAVALADANEPEEAAAAATRMFELSADVGSERTVRRARVVLGRLADYGDVPAVRELLENHPRSA